MKKKMITIAAMAAAMALSATMSIYAGWWVHDEFGDSYVNDDGSGVFMRWFTDPETGYEYYFNPEGYIMKDVYVQSYYLDENGIKREQSDSGKQAIERIEARVAEAEKRGTPAKGAKAAKEAGNAAKVAEKKEAVSTQRLSYQAEMDVFLYQFHTVLRDTARANGNKYEVKIGTDNYITDYYAKASNGVAIMSSKICKASNEKLPDYTPYAFEVNYNRDVAGEDSPMFDTEFKDVVLAAVGEKAGTQLYDKVMQIAVGTDTQLKEEGVADNGNTYTFTYRVNNANIKVTCSEIVPEEETAAEESAAEESAAEETTETASETPAETAAEAASEASSESNADTAAESETAE